LDLRAATVRESLPALRFDQARIRRTTYERRCASLREDRAAGEYGEYRERNKPEGQAAK
jgi:hypothetical protein